MTTIQNNAIRELLSVQGQFFQAMIKLSAYPEYSFDIITDALPVRPYFSLTCSGTKLTTSY